MTIASSDIVVLLCGYVRAIDMILELDREEGWLVVTETFLSFPE